MLSKTKLTFSLTSFIVLIAFGLVCFTPSAFADGRDNTNKGLIFDLGVKISAAESMIDVSAEGDPAADIQIATGRDRAEREFEEGTLEAIILLVEFTHVVNLAEPGGTLEDVEDATVDRGDTADDQPAVKGSGGNFGADDIYVAAYDKEGRALGVLPLDELIADGDTPNVGFQITSFRDSQYPGRQFLVRIDDTHIVNAYAQENRAGNFEVYSFVFFIPQGVGNEPWPKPAPLAPDPPRADALVSRGIKKSTSDHVIAHFGPGAHHHLNQASNQFRVDLVDDDQGNPGYNVGVSDTAIAADGGADTAGTGTPGVVTVDKVRERAGFIETGDFDVRIILTEEPKGGFTEDLIDVENGSVAEILKGATLKGTSVTPAQTSELTLAMASYTGMDNEAAEAGDLPEATGRDNKYHQYFVTITPDPDLEAGSEVTVSVKQFADNVTDSDDPAGKLYVPLTKEQRLAVTLADAEETVRDARVANESVSVRTITGEDDSADAVANRAAEAAYIKRMRKEDDEPFGLLDLNPNLSTIGSKLVIPSEGYLVLARGSVIVSPLALNLKHTAAQKRYNSTGLALPFPAFDLSNFFHNGGTLRLVHADIPEATAVSTGSAKRVHDDAKPSTTKEDDDKNIVVDDEHKDYTGYDGAASVEYAEGDVIISEIMWGLDGNFIGSQYIELYNTTDADIQIDHLEWAIAVGSAPDDFTVIDTVGNTEDPITGEYWQVPGTDGVASVQPSAGFFTLVDLVSMSRVTGATDGTAQASWAQSGTADGTGRQSINLLGRRIGTPGADNIYIMPEMMDDEDDEMMDEPMAPAAEADDIMITEIMVGSNDGRLPQWIELANVSAATVSLSGWSLEIENDAADPDVVGESIEIDLGDTEIGAGEVALVISKEGRNSGVDTAGVARVKGDANAGNLDADRIIDVKSQVSPTNARYSLISEMAFMISLLPPQTGAVRTPGDVAGNLGGGWELPMSEGGRSSLIRREMGDKGAFMGTDAAGWMLASDTMLSGAYRTTYYGSDEDVGTPGYDAGDALPVELSGFNAARDKVTGAVVITWATQSELNNAGFFIKRSQQTKGKFVIVNPTMIAGAGTTAEKQSYTYTDATADPNVIYYYQIEDVSLDGNRQTLTRAHRLKGHIGAAGKATTTWGELKSSRD